MGRQPLVGVRRREAEAGTDVDGVAIVRLPSTVRGARNAAYWRVNSTGERQVSRKSASNERIVSAVSSR
jgi:hypothetical protein